MSWTSDVGGFLLYSTPWHGFLGFWYHGSTFWAICYCSRRATMPSCQAVNHTWASTKVDKKNKFYKLLFKICLPLTSLTSVKSTQNFTDDRFLLRGRQGACKSLSAGCPRDYYMRFQKFYLLNLLKISCFNHRITLFNGLAAFCRYPCSRARDPQWRRGRWRQWQQWQHWGYHNVHHDERESDCPRGVRHCRHRDCYHRHLRPAHGVE